MGYICTYNPTAVVFIFLSSSMMDSFSDKYFSSVKTPKLFKFCSSESCLYSLALFSIILAGLFPDPTVEATGLVERAEVNVFAASDNIWPTGSCWLLCRLGVPPPALANIVVSCGFSVLAGIPPTIISAHMRNCIVVKLLACVLLRSSTICCTFSSLHDCRLFFLLVSGKSTSSSESSLGCVHL